MRGYNLATEYIIYTDESITNGAYFSNFYGGALVSSKHLALVEQTLSESKTSQNLYQEIKWTKVTEQYLNKYVAVMDSFFDLIAANQVKVRIMFTQNRHVPQGLTVQQQKQQYHLLYYQFIKHAFGLRYANATTQTIKLRIYLDQMPEMKEANAQFKAYLVGLQYAPEFRRAKIHIKADQIAEVASHDHVILQCLDVVLGAMQFRLNDKHKAKPENATQRAKKTVAKEKLYKHILGRVRQIYPQFNIGITTGLQGQVVNSWEYAYRHWLFIPTQATIDPTKTKNYGK